MFRGEQAMRMAGLVSQQERVYKYYQDEHPTFIYLSEVERIVIWPHGGVSIEQAGEGGTFQAVYVWPNIDVM